MEVKFWLPLIIAMIALVFTAISTWHAWVSPFKPTFEIGYPLLGLTAAGENNNYYISLLMPVRIYNSGAKGGLIKDIIIIVNKGNHEWILIASSFCEEFSTAALTEKDRENFHSIYIRSRGEVYLPILFNPILGRSDMPHQIFSKNDAQKLKGEYTLNFYSSYGSNSKYKLIKSAVFRITDKVAKMILNGRVFFPPYLEEIETRENFIKKEVLKKHN